MAQDEPVGRQQYQMQYEGSYLATSIVGDETGIQDNQTEIFTNAQINFTRLSEIDGGYLYQMEIASMFIIQNKNGVPVEQIDEVADDLTHPFFLVWQNGTVTNVLISGEEHPETVAIKQGFAEMLQQKFEEGEYTVPESGTAGTFNMQYNVSAENDIIVIEKHTDDTNMLEGTLDEHLLLTRYETAQFDVDQQFLVEYSREEHVSFYDDTSENQNLDENYFDLSMDGNGYAAAYLAQVETVFDTPILTGSLDMQREQLESWYGVESLQIETLLVNPEAVEDEDNAEYIQDKFEALINDPEDIHLLNDLIRLVERDPNGVSLLIDLMTETGDETIHAHVVAILVGVGSEEAQQMLTDNFLSVIQDQDDDSLGILVSISTLSNPTPYLLDHIIVMTQSDSDLSEQAVLVAGALADRASDTYPEKTEEIVEFLEQQLLEQPFMEDVLQTELYLAALGNAAQDRSIPIIAPYLDSEDLIMRIQAAEALRDMPSDEATELLQNRLENETNENVRLIIESLLFDRQVESYTQAVRQARRNRSALPPPIIRNWSQTWGNSTTNATLSTKLKLTENPLYFLIEAKAEAKVFSRQGELAKARIFSDGPNNANRRFGARLWTHGNIVARVSHDHYSIPCGGQTYNGLLYNNSLNFFNRTTPPIRVLGIFRLSFTARVSGSLDIRYEFKHTACNDPSHVEITGKLIPGVKVTVDGYATLSLYLVRGGLGIQADLLNTKTPIYATVGIRQSQFFYCYGADLEFQAISGRLYAWYQTRRWPRLWQWGQRRTLTLWSFASPTRITSLFAVPCPPLPDLGDAPDSTNHSTLPASLMPAYYNVWPSWRPIWGRFPTVYDPNGIQPGPLHHNPTADAWLGSNVSGEIEADQGVDNDGVNNLWVGNWTWWLNTPDHDRYDDGVQSYRFNLPSCGATTVQYGATATSPGSRTLNVWIDFNRDGDWQDIVWCWDSSIRMRRPVLEWAVRNAPVTLGSGYNSRLTPPFSATRQGGLPWHQDRWARVQLTGSGEHAQWGNIPPVNQTFGLPDGRGPQTGYQFGETEDYRIKRGRGWSIFASQPASLSFTRTVVVNNLMAAPTVSDDIVDYLEIPAGATTTSTNLAYIPTDPFIENAGGVQSTGIAFDFELYVDDQLQSSYMFAEPAMLTMHYTDEEVSDLVEGSLELRRKGDFGWLSAACPSMEVEHDMDNNTLIVPLCASGEFVLFGATSDLLTPHLSIPDNMRMAESGEITMPIIFVGNDLGVETAEFTITYDATCLEYMGVDGDVELIAEDTSQLSLIASGESVSSDGALAFVNFAAICEGEITNPVTATVGFEASPVFTTERGDVIEGTSNGGSAVLVYISPDDLTYNIYGEVISEQGERLSNLPGFSIVLFDSISGERIASTEIYSGTFHLPTIGNGTYDVEIISGGILAKIENVIVNNADETVQIPFSQATGSAIAPLGISTQHSTIAESNRLLYVVAVVQLLGVSALYVRWRLRR